MMDVLDFCLPPLWKYMPDAACHAARKRARRVKFVDGQALHARGDRSPRLCVIVEGVLRFGRFQPGGSFNMVAMLGVGGHFGDVALQRGAYTHDVFSVGPSEIDVIDGTALETLLREEPGFALGLWHANTARLNALLELYDDARTLGVPARLAKVIYLHMGRGQVADGVACLQRHLAELLGVSQVSIGNALKELEKAQLVETGYRCIRVPSKARLLTWLRRSRAV